MLNKDEIEKAKKWLNWCKKEEVFLPYTSNISQYIDQLEQENNKQNKIIDVILGYLAEQDLGYYKSKIGGEILGRYTIFNKEDWKQYFEKKIKEKENG